MGADAYTNTTNGNGSHRPDDPHNINIKEVLPNVYNLNWDNNGSHYSLNIGNFKNLANGILQNKDNIAYRGIDKQLISHLHAGEAFLIQRNFQPTADPKKWPLHPNSLPYPYQSKTSGHKKKEQHQADHSTSTQPQKAQPDNKINVPQKSEPNAEQRGLPSKPTDASQSATSKQNAPVNNDRAANPKPDKPQQEQKTVNPLDQNKGLTWDRISKIRYAGDAANAIDEQIAKAKAGNEQLKKQMEDWVSENGGTGRAILGAAGATALDVLNLSMGVTGDFADALRFGEGFAEGGVKGITTDIFRGLNLLPATKMISGKLVRSGVKVVNGLTEAGTGVNTLRSEEGIISRMFKAKNPSLDYLDEFSEFSGHNKTQTGLRKLDVDRFISYVENQRSTYKGRVDLDNLLNYLRDAKDKNLAIHVSSLPTASTTTTGLFSRNAGVEIRNTLSSDSFIENMMHELQHFNDSIYKKELFNQSLEKTIWKRGAAALRVEYRAYKTAGKNALFTYWGTTGSLSNVDAVVFVGIPTVAGGGALIGAGYTGYNYLSPQLSQTARATQPEPGKK